MCNDGSCRICHCLCVCDSSCWKSFDWSRHLQDNLSPPFGLLIDGFLQALRVLWNPGVQLIWKHYAFNCHAFDPPAAKPVFFGKLPFTWQARDNCIEELWKVMDHPRRIVSIAQDVQQVGWWHEVETWERLLLQHKKEENVSLSLGKCSKEILQCPFTCVPWLSHDVPIRSLINKFTQRLYPSAIWHLSTTQAWRLPSMNSFKAFSHISNCCCVFSLEPWHASTPTAAMGHASIPSDPSIPPNCTFQGSRIW